METPTTSSLTTTSRLTDPRDQDLARAEQLMHDIFQARLAILRREAAGEAQVSEIREQVRLDTATYRAALELHEAQLSALILAHQDAFARPRMHTCKWGTYGLRSSSRLEILDEAAVLAWARERGYVDVIKVVESVIKPAVSRRLNAGEDVPSCRIETNQASEYKLDPALIEQEM